MMGMNPLQLMGMLRGAQNPQQMVANIMSKQAGNNPVLQNAVKMMQSGDTKGLETMARNMAREKRIDVDQAVNTIKSQFGLG